MEISYLNFLPTKMLSKDEINGIKIDYEDYLTEILNCSEYFMKLTNREKFIRITEQDNGQADVKASKYEIDFKLLVNQDFVNNKLKSLPDVDYSYLSKGLIGMKAKLNTDKNLTQAKANGLFAIFFNKLSQVTEEQLVDGQKNEKSELYSTIKMFKKRKNILFFLPFEIKCFSDDGVVNTVAKLKNIFNLRDSINKDTFVTVLRKNKDYYDEFYILQYGNGIFQLIDKVPKSQISSFNKMYMLTSFTENIT